ncbi:type II secretion system protein GspD [Horticoccus sp. 23ND18S-11]|uniref:type II secretion system protein GspD n=1 Tax=Horticoccus sp. 23ND18S-11 TaxID=3391832 RepID=UPI0039C9C58D
MNFGVLRIQPRALATVALIVLGAAQASAQTQTQGGRGGPTGGTTGGGGGGGSTSGGNRSYQNTTMIGDATISSDVDTRRLIVVTDAATNENIKAIIASLDKPKPQVLINVVFLQVTHNNNFDLGAEATYKGPISIKTNPEGIASTNFGIESQRRTDTTFYGAFYQLIGRDVNATIHAMSGVAKTEILSRPSILTRSNQQATILVGQQVPLLDTSVQNTNSNSITSTVNYRDVGIILRVTPFITAEGLVEMIVSPEISSLSATTVSIPGSGTAPVIDRRSADTVVVTPSDRTIVIGGLISSQKNDTDTKVPVLGDIPLIGYAFKRKKKEDVKTELLIFLTPHVVKTPDDLSHLTELERAKLNLAPTAFNQADLSKFVPSAKN